MKYLNNKIMIILLCFISIKSFSQENSNKFKLEDLRKIVDLSSPQISPDGKNIAVIVSRPDWEKDSRKQEIDLVNIKNGSIRSITYNRESISNLKWTPDGNKLAFISKDSESKKTQIYVMPMNGGDPIKITESKTGVNEFSWSPDGSMIAFVAQDTIPNPKEIKHHEDAFKVTFNNYLVSKEIQPWHLWIVSSNGGKAKRLTEGKFSLCTDQGSISPVEWSKDGKSIFFQKFPDVWEGNAWHSTIAEVDTSGSEIKTLIKDEGSGFPSFNKNNILAFIRPRNGDQNNGNAVYIKKEKEISDITKNLERNINSYKWMPDGNSLLLTGEKGTHSVIWNQMMDGNSSVIDLENIEAGNGSISISNNNEIAFIGKTSSRPEEIYLLTSLNSKPKRLTDYNNFIDSIKLGNVQTVNWKGPDGFDEDGVLTFPVDYKDGQKYPLVLEIHGGPEGASTVAFSPLTQLFSAQNFFIFQPNYRGSINLGDKYQHAIFRDTGEGPGKDVMTGLEKVISSDLIDTNKIGVSGWSYGGYMTSWLNGYYPNKWKAAVEGAALNDWVMDYTIAYYQRGDLYFFGGSPWVEKYWDIWRDQSPIIFAKNVKAPTLILGDAGDENVPIVNSYEMYHALLDNGVTTEFYVYPADVHFPHDIVRQTDIFKKWIDWMVKYLR